MSIEEHIKNAVFSHTKTTKLLQDYIIYNKRSPETLEKIGQGYNCDFGKWLEGPETLLYHQKLQFEDLKRLHNIYHTEITRIVACVQKNEINLARVLMNDKDYQQTLSQFIESLFNFLEQVKKDEDFKSLKKR